VVQTLHNFRLFCANALLFRNGDICERCFRKTIPMDAIRFGCYRNSKAASAAAVVATCFHKSTGIHERNVSAFIALTNFSRRKFMEAGLPEAKVFVKPNFVELSPIGTEGQRNGFLFVGRISPEKGLRTLLEAWRTLQPIGAPLKIIGDGPESQRLRREFSDLHVEWLGIRSRGDILRAMRAATAVVVPSLWYEGFPLVVVEAFSVGAPVLASAIGSLEEIVQNTVHGLHFGRGDAQDLSEKIRWAKAHPAEMDTMGRNARRECELKYSEDANLSQLLDIYESVLRSQVEQQSRTRVAAATD
jgi:glycosyltransferase involved in cell wall biosynthesis